MSHSYGFSPVIHALNELITRNTRLRRNIRKWVTVVIDSSPALKIGPTCRLVFCSCIDLLITVYKNISLMSLSSDKITGDAQTFKGRINIYTARKVNIPDRIALRILSKIKIPFTLNYSSEDFVKPVTSEKIVKYEGIEVDVIPRVKQNIFDDYNVYSGRTLESIMLSMEQSY